MCLMTFPDRVSNLQRSALAFALGSTLLGLAPSADAARRVITFQNNSGQVADDLHIETKQGCSVEWASTTPFNSERGVNGGSKHNLYNGTVPVAGTATVALTSDSETIEVEKWWWTSGGNALRDGARIGDVRSDNGGAILAAYDGRANGDGAVLVTIGDMADVFVTTPGADSILTALLFAEFLDRFQQDEFDLIHSGVISPNETLALGNLLGDEATELHVELLERDSGLRLEVRSSSARLQLSVAGECPGFTELQVSGAFPGGQVAYVYGFAPGSTPAPVCHGLVIAIAQPVLAGVAPVDPFGGSFFGGEVPPAACGRALVQALDLLGCAASNTVLLGG